VAHPIERKVQQSGTQAETPKKVAKIEDRQRDARRTFKMLRGIARYWSRESRHA